MPELTDKQYVEAGGNKCPNCLSENVENTGAAQTANDYRWRLMRCRGGKSTWNKNYVLAGYSALDVPTGGSVWIREAVEEFHLAEEHALQWWAEWKEQAGNGDTRLGFMEWLEHTLSS